MEKSKALRELLARKELIIAPGAYDALSAKVIEKVGFKVIYITGFGVAASHIGKPDVGLTTLTEIVNVAGRVTRAVSTPVICDADTGFGNAINTMRTTEEFIGAGVAAIHIEDQVAPKRCGHVAGKQLISIAEAVGKYRASDRVRRELDPDFVLIARTDARGALGGGLDEVIRRGRAYAEAGADIVFPDALTDLEELEQCVKEIPVPILYNMAGLSPYLPMSQLQEMGVGIVIDPGGAFRSAVKAIWDYMYGLKTEGTESMTQFNKGMEGHAMFNFFEFIGFPEIRRLEEEYLPSEEVHRKYAETIGYQP